MTKPSIATNRRSDVAWIGVAALGAMVLATGNGAPCRAQEAPPTTWFTAAHSGRVDSIHVGEQLPRFSLLRAGTRRYVRYTTDNGHRSPIDIWTRTISFDTQDGQRRMRIQQRWDEVGQPPLWLDQDASFELGTFRPLTHVKTRQHGDTVLVGGYRFLPDRIVGMDELPNNSRNGFSVPSPEPAFDFEYDMELLQTLALRDGYRASIVFYDPARDPPARYTFVVAGSASIDGPDGRPIECWVVTADYNTGHVVSTFWFAKRTQVLIREESHTKSGGVLVKSLLYPEADSLGASA